MSKSLESALSELGFEVARLDRASLREGPTWECKIGVTDEKSAVLAGGADLPMRRAIEAEFARQTGMEPDFIFSGWGAVLTEGEREVVYGRPAPLSIKGYRGSGAKAVTLLLSDGSELDFDPDDFPSGSG